MPESVSAGTTIAGYRIEEPIGRGGMGVVYRATHMALDRPVALKLITDELAEDDGFRERFRREPQLAASIDHPNVIPVFDAGEDEGRLFVAMRLIDGTDLGAEIAQRKRLDPKRAATIVAQVADGLDAAHELGLVHRDVKPANILLEKRRGKEYVYLTDFGLTKAGETTSGGMTKTGQWLGTPDYVAPEQIEGRDLDGRADVYALGAVLYHALAGKAPYASESEVAKIYAHMSKPPPPLPKAAKGVPEDLAATIERAMAKDPAERYQSAGEFGEEAMTALTGKGELSSETRAFAGATVPAGAKRTKAAGATPAAEPVEEEAVAKGPPSRGGKQRQGRRRGLLVGAIVAGVAVIGAGAFLLLGSGGGGGGDGAGGSASTEALKISTDTVGLAQQVGSDANDLAVAINGGSDTAGMRSGFDQLGAKAKDLSTRAGELPADAPGRDGLDTAAAGLAAASSDLSGIATSGGTPAAAESARSNMDRALTGLSGALEDLRSAFTAEGADDAASAVSTSIDQLSGSSGELATPFDNLITAIGSG